MISLADMPPEQLDASRGMWVESNTGTLGIIRKTLYSVKRRSSLVQVLWPAFDNAGGGHTHFTPLDMLTLRDDLPRAWTPQGAPMPGRWEEGTAEFSDWVDDSSEYGGWGESGLIFNEDGEPCGEPLEYAEWSKKVTEVARTGSGIEGKTRRFVADWEPVE